jgi:hypothetical protein
MNDIYVIYPSYHIYHVVIIDVKIDIIIMNEPTNLKKFGLTRIETFFFYFSWKIIMKNIFSTKKIAHSSKIIENKK